MEYGSPGYVRLRSANPPARSTEASVGEGHLLSQALFMPGVCWHDLKFSSPQIRASSSATHLRFQKVPPVLTKMIFPQGTQRYSFLCKHLFCAFEQQTL